MFLKLGVGQIQKRSRAKFKKPYSVLSFYKEVFVIRSACYQLYSEEKKHKRYGSEEKKGI